MNIKKSLVTFTAAASLAVTGLGISNLTNTSSESHVAHAATTDSDMPSVVRANSMVKLYTAADNNSKLAGRSLAEGSDWAVLGQETDAAGNLWYALGGNQWVKAAEMTANPTTEEATTQAPSTQSAVENLINTAKAYVGTPYVWGGKTPSGFDCSGFTSYVYQEATGKSIGGYTVAQESAGQHESVQSASAGDLLFWGSEGSTYHVGIYLGNNQYIAAPQPGENVKIASISSYFMPSFAVKVL
ncbi:C40 family peptidase [Companilactobacillus sp.]|uniref:C40 family peptidase n=1 Tax=Companilactobacillus sp. TaxID=2767905 RepID=UPI0025B9B869|nr:C40 family peptidase [Companilactobacillus sp.]MCH4009514.1 C40 family peptidase [Companilactobacillus sp.]MCH4052810.1 C40 family peptidase [Companilactobacillus sp.]MCH4077456.1 C40 family peptidase [Companilactobacillus sp.]MCH4126032.1 C40 family peptidase [Companilactobacillus sp.]MCI1311740.1 C40 family peptidase [Companilactobacillus sp.]